MKQEMKIDFSYLDAHEILYLLETYLDMVPAIAEEDRDLIKNEDLIKRTQFVINALRKKN